MAQVTQQTLDRLRVPSTATLTSVLKGHGLANTFLHEVAPLRPDTSMAGRAFTLRYIPAREDLVDVPMDNLTDQQRVGIEQMQPGDVLVIDARGDTRAGTMGSILAARMARLGAAGVVTDGAYRDSPAIAASGFPAYARAMNAHTNKTIHYPSEIQVPVACGGVAVFPGDVIVGDGEGVVVIPDHLAGGGGRRGRGAGVEGGVHHREDPRRRPPPRDVSPRRGAPARVRGVAAEPGPLSATDARRKQVAADIPPTRRVPMLEIFKVPVEPLTPEAFAPFGSVIRTFDETRPEVRVGGLTENHYTVTADVSDPPPEKLSLSEGRLRAHFACHDDAGQSFYPTRHCPTVFLVAAPGPSLNPEDLRAFHSDGSLGRLPGAGGVAHHAHLPGGDRGLPHGPRRPGLPDPLRRGRLRRRAGTGHRRGRGGVRGGLSTFMDELSRVEP